MEFYQLFTRIGLNEKERKTFLHLLELGAQPISVIAKHVGIPRTTMYVVIESLRKHQLVELFERSGVKYVKCIPASAIPNVLKNRVRQIEQTISIVEETLPNLQALENKLSITPKVKFFEGKDEVKEMYEKILTEKSFCAFVDLASVKKNVPEFHEEIPKMIRGKGGTARELAVYSQEAMRYQKFWSSERHNIKILPKGMQFASDIIICSERIYMTAYGDGKVSAVELFSVSLAQTQQGIFDALWEQN